MTSMSLIRSLLVAIFFQPSTFRLGKPGIGVQGHLGSFSCWGARGFEEFKGWSGNVLTEHMSRYGYHWKVVDQKLTHLDESKIHWHPIFATALLWGHETTNHNLLVWVWFSQIRLSGTSPKWIVDIWSPFYFSVTISTYSYMYICILYIYIYTWRFAKMYVPGFVDKS